MWAARHGVSYEEILAFYYSGAALAHGYGLGGAADFEEEIGGEMGMKLVESLLTKNPCYTAGRKITVKGLMLHSVGCPQPVASVFLNSWNSPSYSNACVHGFIDGNSSIFMRYAQAFSEGRISSLWILESTIMITASSSVSSRTIAGIPKGRSIRRPVFFCAPQ